MYLFIILLQPAILWFVIYFIVGEKEAPSFRSLILPFLLIAIVSAFISYKLSIFPPIVSSIIIIIVLTIFYRIEFIKSIITTAVFFGVMFGINLIDKFILGR